MSATKGFGDRLAQERRLKAAREGRDIGQKDVAAAIGSSGPSVSRWEAGLGVPSDRMVEKLAQYFGVTLGWLRYGEGERVESGAPLLPLQKPQRAIIPHKKSGGKGRA